MSSVVPLVPWHITISASPQSNNQQLQCNEGELGELEVIWPITGGHNKPVGTGTRKVKKRDRHYDRLTVSRFLKVALWAVNLLAFSLEQCTHRTRLAAML